jgi:hypothetical protein
VVGMKGGLNMSLSKQKLKAKEAATELYEGEELDNILSEIEKSITIIELHQLEDKYIKEV